MSESTGSRGERARLHRVLADPGCRTVLDALRGTDRIRFGSLVDALVASEAGGEPVEDDATVERRAVIRLHHSQLPRLAAVDAVAYDRDAGTVRSGPVAPLAYDLLDEVAAVSGRAEFVGSAPAGGEDA
jgi:hypothetical protein